MPSDSKNHFGFPVDEYPEVEHTIKSPCSWKVWYAKETQAILGDPVAVTWGGRK